jgi:hypothetical protein
MSNKYHAIKCEIDGYIFASKREARRYSELKLLYNAGEIFDLQLQPKFEIKVNKVHIGWYIADFQYETEDGDVIVEDVKSAATRKIPLYRLKKKLVEALYGIEVIEVK